MTEHEQFKQEVAKEIHAMGESVNLQQLTRQWMDAANAMKYSYHFDWQGRPIIQYPQDIVAMQELIFEVKPDLIIETGIARGGSLVFSASMLALLDMYDAIAEGVSFNPKQSKRKVVGLEIDIRSHNRQAIEAHPLASRIEMIEGSSVAPEIVARVNAMAKKYSRVLVYLDSNHTHEHVLAELQAYAPLTSVGSYCVVFDTVIEDMPKSMFPDRPWGPGNNPKTAVNAYLKDHPEFVIDRSVQNKLQVTVAPDGYLKRVR